MIEIKVNVTDGASQTLRKLIAGISGPGMAALNEAGGRAAVLAAIAYHREFDKEGGWKGKRYLGPSRNDGSSFGADVARGWNLASHSPDGAVIANAAQHYKFKVTGGTIVPKRVKNLTIPLIPEARGLYAAVYQQNTGRKLFTIPGKRALFEKTEDGKIRSVYALVKSITMNPWPGALPPEAAIASAFVARFREELREILS